MEQELRLAPRPLKRLRLTPGLKQALHILSLSVLELREFLEKQIEENPLLEVVAGESQRETDRQDSQFDTEKEAYKQTLVTQSPSLYEHLLKQLHMLELNEKEYELGEYIIGNIDENGYLKANIDEIASSQGVKVEDAEKILFSIQTFEPPGVGARNLEECLILQLKAKNREYSLAAQIAKSHLEDLAKRRFKVIAKSLKVSLEEVKKAKEEIVKLEPKPGRPFGINHTVKVVPDIILEATEDGLQIKLARDELPCLRINPKYQQLLNDGKTPENTKEFLRERLNSALWLIRAIEQRQVTLKKITQAIVDVQKKAIVSGTSFLKPLILKDIARISGLHISTVSRTVADKYIDTPQGIFRLKDLFSGKIKSERGSLISTRRIKSEIKGLISREDKKHTLSDQQIAMFLNKRNIGLSRRAVAKYRKELKILPSYLRREID